MFRNVITHLRGSMKCSKKFISTYIFVFSIQYLVTVFSRMYRRDFKGID